MNGCDMNWYGCGGHGRGAGDEKWGSENGSGVLWTLVRWEGDDNWKD